MKCYEITIKPRSGFGTPLKGDTLFGHFCWQVHYDPGILNGGLDRWIDCYDTQPCAVFSTAWPKLRIGERDRYALKRPALPLSRLFPDMGKDRRKRMRERKTRSHQKWIVVDENLHIDLKAARFMSDRELACEAAGDLQGEARRRSLGTERCLMTAFLQPHNTINRQTMTTGEGMFAPYTMPSIFYSPETKLAVFVLIDETATDIERVRRVLERIGNRGFGRDASTGLGRFDVINDREKDLPTVPGANACYTLAPSVPEKGMFGDCYFTPFTRFGRHGDLLAITGTPFKNPIIMADEGAVLIPADGGIGARPYLGTSVRNLSKSEPRTVAQGYAPFLPLKLEIRP